ncbi:hypothetical protein RJ639_037523 [Escallonia herrerae]|uniref:Cation/H+ exchanger transmembrane domain-containing protein n=1 Tax=Escallonia herrerae TaxID=1293975 RepID=A0AA88WL06_9ASTE|nr:hypothetical protein RJ639_037523 [Escallonia herrerae]
MIYLFFLLLSRSSDETSNKPDHHARCFGRLQMKYVALSLGAAQQHRGTRMGGIILGPSGFGRNKAFHDLLFPGKGLMVLDVYEIVGLILFCFLIGVRTDFAVVKRAGRLSLAVGVASFLVPMLINIIMLNVFRIGTKTDKSFSSSLYHLAHIEAMINYQAMSNILTNLKLVNSELGRVALSSSMISSLCTWISALLRKTVEDAAQGLALLTLARVSSRFLLLAVAIFLIRPIMLWMIKHTPEERTLRESYVCAITLWVFAAALYSEINGINPIFSCIIIGMAVPGGPPLASGLVEKLESFVSAVLLPSFAANIGRKVNIYLIRPRHFAMVEGFVILAICGKIVASMVPSMYWHMPLRDTFLVGLLLSCQGLLDIQFMNQALHSKFIDQETMTIAVIMAIVHAIVITPVVRRLYDPSRRYPISHKRRTIQESKQDELRILACIHHEDNIPKIIDILEASNPTRESPIEVHVLVLEELVGRAMPLFISHRLSRNPSTKSGRTRRIIKAFRQYELRNQGLVISAGKRLATWIPKVVQEVCDDKGHELLPHMRQVIL